MAKRDPGTPPKYGYVIVNHDGLFGLYLTRREADDYCTSPDDVVHKYTYVPAPRVPKRAKKDKR